MHEDGTSSTTKNKGTKRPNLSVDGDSGKESSPTPTISNKTTSVPKLNNEMNNVAPILYFRIPYESVVIGTSDYEGP